MPAKPAAPANLRGTRRGGKDVVADHRDLGPACAVKLTVLVDVGQPADDGERGREADVRARKADRGGMAGVQIMRTSPEVRGGA